MSGKKINSPRSPGVGFFNHFPRQRLRPYGKIKEATPDDTINCEYLCRPSVALSELADSVIKQRHITDVIIIT